MAFDSFLKIEGIAGESRDSKHKDEIEVLSFAFGVSNAGTPARGGGTGAGKATFEDFHFVHRLDKASPTLMLACASGQHFKQALLTLRKAGKGQLEYLKIKLTDVLVSSYRLAGSGGGDDVPLGELSLNYGTVRMDYTTQSEKGAAGDVVSADWDLKSGRKR
jgi:type VI secretion system secreted protein Hcp